MRRSIVLCVALALAPIVPAEGAEPDRLIFDSQRPTIFTVEGYYPHVDGDVCDFTPAPLVARYRGSLEVEVVDGAIRIINELPFTQYLRGIAEVPLSWPTQALRAQAIAARSYALYHYQRGRDAARERGWHICATDQCQVYRGAAIELGAFGDRWVAAIKDTRGEVLKHGGRVIQAFYHSTTTGRTRPSFPGGTPLPYLQSVPGRDRDAPLARWTAPIETAHATALLRALGAWRGGRITLVRDRGDAVSLSDGERTTTMSKSSFRAHMRSLSCMFDGYPNPSGTQTGGRLPEEVPSSTYSVEKRGDRIVVSGQGWGHDVGMSQWGAYALARRGWSAERILTYYYRDVSIDRRSEPRALRVKAAEGLRRLRVFTGDQVEVTTGSGDVLHAGDRFEITVQDGRLRVKRFDGERLDPLLEVKNRTTSLTGHPGERARVVFRLSRSARVVVRALDGNGAVVSSIEPGSLEAGRHTVRLPLDGIAPGTYQIHVEGDDGIDLVRSGGSALDVLAEPGEPPAPPGASTPWVTMLAAAALVAVGLGRLLARRLSRT